MPNFIEFYSFMIGINANLVFFFENGLKPNTIYGINANSIHELPPDIKYFKSNWL